MSSRERPALLVSNVRLGWLLLRAEWPVGVWLVGYLLPETVRMLVFVLIGRVVGGPAGVRHALVGCFVLAIASATVAHVTDLPVIDVTEGTFRTVLRGSVPPVLQYAARSAPLVVMAIVTACAAAVVSAAVTSQGDLLLPLLAHAWMLVPAAAGATALGLLVIAPAIGSAWEGITYNAATALLTVLTGAVFAPTHPLPALIGQLLPLTHTIEAVRRSLAQESFADQLLLELAVGVAWAAAAALAYRRQVTRGRRLGQGAFAA